MCNNDLELYSLIEVCVQTFTELRIKLDLRILHAAFLSVSMHFIRGWPWQQSWSRVISGVSMRRGSSNKVVGQRSSSSNTTDPTDTPSGSELTHSMLFCRHISYLCLFAYSSLLTKKQNQAARKILRFLLRCRHRWGVTINTTTLQTCLRAQKHTHYLHMHLQPTVTCPHNTGANSWYCFTVSVKPIDGPKAYETGESFLPLLSLPLSWCPFACQWRQGRGCCGLPTLPPSLSPSLRGLRNGVATSAWLTDRGTVLSHSPSRGHVPTDMTWRPRCLVCLASL